MDDTVAEPKAPNSMQPPRSRSYRPQPMAATAAVASESSPTATMTPKKRTYFGDEEGLCRVCGGNTPPNSRKVILCDECDAEVRVKHWIVLGFVRELYDGCS